LYDALDSPCFFGCQIADFLFQSVFVDGSDLVKNNPSSDGTALNKRPGGVSFPAGIGDRGYDDVFVGYIYLSA
jgi:hypothetical protein